MTTRDTPIFLPLTQNREMVAWSMNQPQLFPLRVSTKYPSLVNSADLSFSCEADRGETFYCKSDKDGRIIRATEWLLTFLANHLGIPTAECAALIDPESGDRVFGSRQVLGAAAPAEAKAYLMQPQKNELGQPSAWPGAFLSGLYAFDLFVGNPDRGLNNFLLQREGLNRRLIAFDFASARLDILSGRNFPVATCPTVKIGKLLRSQHGIFRQSAFEMIDRIAATPAETIEAFLGSMPDDWLNRGQREGIHELWSKKRLGGRLTALRTGLADESLL